MEMNRPAVNPAGDGEFKRDPLCSFLDELVAMRWVLSKGLRDNPDLPAKLATRLWRAGGELDVTITELKALIGEKGLPF